MANFIKSAVNEADWIKDDITEICLLGKSNVGKSSLVNALANKDIAITSKNPGCTKTINFYNIDKKIRLIDLPGYGFANVGIDKQKEIASIIHNYIINRTNLFLPIIVLNYPNIDETDYYFFKILTKKFKNYLIVINKIDKVDKNEYKNIVEKVKNTFKISHFNDHIVFVSTKKNINIKELNKMIWKIINKIVV